MNLKSIFAESLVTVNLASTEKTDAIRELAGLLLQEGIVSDKELYIKDVIAREKEISTELENGVALPHARSSAVKKAAVAIGISKTGILFGDGDAKSDIIILIAMPYEATDEHIRVLAHVTGKLIEKDCIDGLRTAKKPAEVIALLSVEVTTEVVSSKKDRFLIGVTGCASGVAHTYLAEKALIKSANELGVSIKVETNGSIGVDGTPTCAEIEQAEAIIIASDKEVALDRFDGKKVIFTGVKKAINAPDELIKKALSGDVPIFKGSGNTSSESSEANKGIFYKALMNGVSHMIPFTVIGGLMVAIAFAIGGEVVKGALVIPEASIWFQISEIGSVGMTLMIPILAGYIAYAIGDRPALAPAMIGGWIANNGSFYNADSGMGFLGAILAGFIVGYLVKYIKMIKFPNAIQPLVPIVIIPITASLIIAFLFIFVVGAPIASLMDVLYKTLQNLNGGSIIILGIVMGFMQGFDMGGPFGKTLLLFSIALMSDGQYQIMGAQAMAIPVAPLGMAIATFIDRKRKVFSEAEAANGKAALVMGLVGISEGAIPFAASDPLAVIPANMIGSAVACVLSLSFGITDSIAWGGPIIVALGLTNGPILAIICMLAGALSTAAICLAIKSFKLKRN